MSDDLVIIIVTFNSAAVLGDLLDSLPEACEGVPFRTYVVDNDSRDATVELARSRGDCTVVTSPNHGYAAAYNLGVVRSGASAEVLLLNPDTRLEPRCVATMRDRLRRSGAGIVVPTLEEAGGSVARSLRRRPTLLRSIGLGRSGGPRVSEIVHEERDYTRAHPVDWATGAVVLVSAECRARVGPMDEVFFMYSEETDFCLRAGDAGLETWFEPRARARHEGAGSGTSPELYAMQALNRVRLYRRRHHLTASAAYYGLVLLRELCWALAGSRDARCAVWALLTVSRQPDLLPVRRHPLVRLDPWCREPSVDPSPLDPPAAAPPAAGGGPGPSRPRIGA